MVNIPAATGSLRSNYSLPSISLKSRHQETKQIAIASLKEFAIGLTMVGVTCFFVATPLSIGIGITMTAILALSNFGYRILESSEMMRAQTPVHRCLQKVYTFLRAIGFGTVYSGTIDTVVHESGHALMARAVYQNADPKIVIKPFGSGETRYFVGTLSKLGLKLGANKAQLLVVAAGALAALSVSIVFITVAHCIGKEHAEIARYLNGMGFMSILNHGFYALSGLSKTPPEGHDFADLWHTGGIHPAVSIAVLIGVPLFLKGILCLIDHVRARYATTF